MHRLKALIKAYTLLVKNKRDKNLWDLKQPDHLLLLELKVSRQERVQLQDLLELINKHH